MPIIRKTNTPKAPAAPPTRPGPVIDSDDAIQSIEDMRAKMYAEMLAMQHRIEGVDMALKILREPPF